MAKQSRISTPKEANSCPVESELLAPVSLYFFRKSQDKVPVENNYDNGSKHVQREGQAEGRFTQSGYGDLAVEPRITRGTSVSTRQSAACNRGLEYLKVVAWSVGSTDPSALIHLDYAEFSCNVSDLAKLDGPRGGLAAWDARRTAR